jgi:hypothetical protein
MKDPELAKAIANIYGAGWWSDETCQAQLRILRTTVLVPLLGQPVLDVLENVRDQVGSDRDFTEGEVLEALSFAAERLRDVLIGERGSA